MVTLRSHTRLQNSQVHLSLPPPPIPRRQRRRNGGLAAPLQNEEQIIAMEERSTADIANIGGVLVTVGSNLENLQPVNQDGMVVNLCFIWCEYWLFLQIQLFSILNIDILIFMKAIAQLFKTCLHYLEQISIPMAVLSMPTVWIFIVCGLIRKTDC